jgi:hypothetical protein
MTVDLSAQQNNQQKKKTQNTNRTRNTNKNVNRNTTVHRSVNTRTNTKTNTRTRNVTTTRTNNKTNVTTTRSRTTVTTNKKPPRQVTFSSNRQTFKGTRARTWHNSGHWSYRGRNYSYWRHGPWRHRYGNGWRTYAALTTLAAIAFGTATYYPYAYLDVPVNYCDGITEDGCQLSWTEVETLEGGVAPACVAYCPWQ